MGVHGGFSGGQRGGNRQSRASGDAAGACAPWPAQKRAPCEQLGKADYDRYDLFIGMDRENLRRMERIFGGDPLHKIALLMAYTGEPREIEDPWYTDRYDVVYDEVDAGCEALLNELEQERRIKGKHYE